MEKVIAIKRIKDKFLESASPIEIPLLKGNKSFQAAINNDGLASVI